MNMLHDTHLPILLVMGVALVLGTLGARIFQILRIPQVVGYIVIGVLLGKAGLGLIGPDTAARLQPVGFFALGVIGFMIGGELHRDVFRRHGRKFFAILLAEGMTAFVLVAVVVAGLAWWLTGSIRLAAALGLVLGAIASATAPAATVDVLWEYKARGILTTTVFAIVALDDGLALLLFAVAGSIASLLLQTSDAGLWESVGRTIYELLGAAGLGVVSGMALNGVLRRLHERGKALAFIMGVLALVIGVSLLLGLDMILAAMSLGCTLANLAPRRSHRAFDLVESFSSPIYALFFVAVGARLDIQGMPGWGWMLAVSYVLGRSAGKWLGAWQGARWSRASDPVRRYLGLCLFSQAGVAIGLAMLAGDRLDGIALTDGVSMGSTVMAVVTATTFLVQLIGPSCVKMAVTRAGEAGMDITEEDLASTYLAGDVAEAPVALAESMPLTAVLATISETEAVAYPVVDADGTLSGVITIDDFRKSFRAQQMGAWLLAYDLMQPAPDPAPRDMPLTAAMNLMRDQGLDYLPVVEDRRGRRLTGLLQRHVVQRMLAGEVLRRREHADAGILSAAG